MKTPAGLAALLLALPLIPDAAFSGTRVSAESRRLDVEGAAAERSVIWIDGFWLRVDSESGQGSLLYRRQDERLWFLDHAAQTYVEVSRGQAKAASQALDQVNESLRRELGDLPPERRAALERLLDDTLGQPEPSLPPVSVRRTGRSDRVADVACDEVEVRRGEERVALACAAAAGAAGVDPEAVALLRALASFARETVQSLSSLAPGRLQREGLDALASLEQVDGIPLRIRAFQQGRAVAEAVVTEILTAQPSPELFRVPSGYRAGFSFGGRP